MTWFILLAGLVALVAALFSAGMAVVAGADPEGRGGTYVMWGLFGAVILLVLGACLIGWAIVRWLS